MVFVQTTAGESHRWVWEPNTKSIGIDLLGNSNIDGCIYDFCGSYSRRLANLAHPGLVVGFDRTAIRSFICCFRLQPKEID